MVPRVYRAVDAVLDRRPAPGEAADVRPTPARPPTRADRHAAADTCRRSSSWGSWIGGDRDGNPNVTAEVTVRTLRIHADHILHGLEAVATRLSHTIAVAGEPRVGPRRTAS